MTPELNSSENPLQAKRREVPGLIRRLRRARKVDRAGLGLNWVFWFPTLFRPQRRPKKDGATGESFSFPPFRQNAPEGWGNVMLSRAQVAERLMAADCKSAAPCELRRFESSPVHHDSGQ